jgi:hypothetical protein
MDDAMVVGIMQHDMLAVHAKLDTLLAVTRLVSVRR